METVTLYCPYTDCGIAFNIRVRRDKENNIITHDCACPECGADGHIEKKDQGRYEPATGIDTLAG